MEYQRTALWEFYKKWITNKDVAFAYGRGSGKMFVYQIMKELIAYEHQSDNGINKWSSWAQNDDYNCPPFDYNRKL